MTMPLPFAWPYFLIFWPTYFWVYLPESRVLNKATRSGPIPTEDGGSLRIVMIGFSLATLLGFLIPFVVPQAALPGPRWLWFVLGLITLVIGSLLRRHCFRTLGAFFTGAVTIQSDHRVIDSGAYRWVRHPAYSAGLLIVVGTSLSLGNWLGLVVSLAIAFFVYLYRARIEEQALLSSLGDPYARFMAGRKRFIPYIC